MYDNNIHINNTSTCYNKCRLNNEKNNYVIIHKYVYCNNCGNLYEISRYEYCPYCSTNGLTDVVDEEIIYCPQCGNKIDLYTMYCPFCGEIISI